MRVKNTENFTLIILCTYKGITMNFAITEYQPGEALQPYVHSYWHGRFNLDNSKFFSQKVIPNGYIELIIHLSEKHCFLYQSTEWSQSPSYTLIGLFTKPYEVNFHEYVRTFGIRFKPEGIYNLFGIPAVHFSEDYIDMECVLNRSFSTFTNHLTDQKDIHGMIDLANAYLQKNLSMNNINYYYLNRAAEMIRNTNGMMRIDDLISNVFISNRQLEREFKDKMGISPKYYMRIARLNAANRLLQDVENENLTMISYDSGYADQAHFIREFKTFSGISPKKFLKGKKDFIVNV